ncbi:hypothetical protein [Methylobacterium sp. J-068]|uniref:hypothetical protein n=1 Tax=Methylobacterium sp. J-068 TaxID=2836649 RepID=UPI001FB9BEE2|nr:hypothetical protein [Methylobacterium sp. J-068]MCJ2034537.1 hypothetical protein [Methylobacterium sp. J-068]
MSDTKPFLLTAALDALPKGAVGDFLMPLCKSDVGLMMGLDLAVAVLTTIEGQRVGVPLTLESIPSLRTLLTEALRMLQAPEGGSVQ